MTKWILGALIGLALLAGSASADAASFGPQESVAFHIAEAYWGGQPPLCTSLKKRTVTEEYLRHVPPPAVAGETVLATATKPDRRPVPCEIDIAADLPWEYLCATMVHEVGHLWGLSHSPDPSNPMYFQPAPGLVPQCVAGIDPGPPA